MAMLPTGIYTQVENRLKGRWTAIEKAEQALEKAREKARACGGIPVGISGGGKRNSKSRVERMAVLIVSAESMLETAWKWDAVFRKMDEIFPPDGSNEGFVASLMYGNGMTQEDVCRFTHCARQTIRRRRDRYINYCAILAAHEGLIDMKGLVNDGDADPEG